MPVEDGRLTGPAGLRRPGRSGPRHPGRALARTWSYLLGASGAAAVGSPRPGWPRPDPGHAGELADWVGHRLAWLDVHPAASVGLSAHPVVLADPARRGAPAARRRAARRALPDPAEQLSDTSPQHLQDTLFDRISRLDRVASGPSMISVPGARVSCRSTPPAPMTRSWWPRSRSSRTCTPSTTDRCTSRCRPTWPATPSRRGGRSRTCGPGSGSRRLHAGLRTAGRGRARHRHRHRRGVPPLRPRAPLSQAAVPRRSSSRDMAGVAVMPCSSTERTTVKATVNHSHDSSGTSWWLVA